MATYHEREIAEAWQSLIDGNAPTVEQIEAIEHGLSDHAGYSLDVMLTEFKARRVYLLDAAARAANRRREPERSLGIA